MRKPSKKTLRNKCDTLCSKLCRSIGYCERCGRTETLQWVHFISRAVIRLRYNPKNFGCLCYRCHRWAHQHPKAFSVFWDKLKGQGTTQQLEKKSNTLIPLTIEFYQEVYEKLKELYDKN